MQTMHRNKGPKSRGLHFSRLLHYSNFTSLLGLDEARSSLSYAIDDLAGVRKLFRAQSRVASSLKAPVMIGRKPLCTVQYFGTAPRNYSWVKIDMQCFSCMNTYERTPLFSTSLFVHSANEAADLQMSFICHTRKQTETCDRTISLLNKSALCIMTCARGLGVHMRSICTSYRPGGGRVGSQEEEEEGGGWVIIRSPTSNSNGSNSQQQPRPSAVALPLRLIHPRQISRFYLGQ